MTVPTENQEAERLSNWLRNNKYKFTHIANESGLPPKVAMLAAKRKKRMGLSPWFPDYCIILRRGSLLFIELKRQRAVLKNGKLWASPSKTSNEQIEWIDELNQIPNIQAEVCYGCDESIETIKRIEDSIN